MDDKSDPNPGENASGVRDSAPPKWAGFAEIDRAIAENRLTEYRWKKAWADPWGRKLTIFVIASFVGVFGYLVGASFGWWH